MTTSVVNQRLIFAATSLKEAIIHLVVVDDAVVMV